ncbi:PREDICTED: uncharacterized protein LOC109340605 [Lupinus angustifolius]|uniref:uncharacterized protein LOC109340605 n=1 Tax=Lupinus angustifolius TaxID=3871 RepID=UPI00092E414B|nr:PREDICTED: uncharacterized protein LOC109340605 [Lupinus angustifolius]
MRRHFELMQMDESERVSEFFNRIITLSNGMKSCMEKITDLTIVEKVMRTLHPKFDHIVVVIEESRDLEKLKIEELQGSLEAHEQRIIERSGGKSPDQALQAQVFKKIGSFGRGIEYKGKGRGIENKGSSKNGTFMPESSRRGGYKGSYGNKKRIDKRRLKCYNCRRLGHFSNECQLPSQAQEIERHDDEVNMVKGTTGEDDVSIILMMKNGPEELGDTEIWYLDSRCSNLMTGHRT